MANDRMIRISEWVWKKPPRWNFSIFHFWIYSLVWLCGNQKHTNWSMNDILSQLACAYRILCARQRLFTSIHVNQVFLAVFTFFSILRLSVSQKTRLTWKIEKLDTKLLQVFVVCNLEKQKKKLCSFLCWEIRTNPVRNVKKRHHPLRNSKVRIN